MGWFQRMQRTSMRKKKRKLQAKIKKYYNNPSKAAKYQQKLDALNAKFSTHNGTAPAPAAPKPKANFERDMELRQRELEQLQAMVSQRQQTAPAANTTSSQTAASAPKKPVNATATPAAQRPPVTTQTSHPVSSGPRVPAGNYFASHEQLISKIARTAAQRCAHWIRSQDKEWKPINNGYSSQYSVDITVSKEGVEFNKLAYEGLHSIWFKGLGMSELQQTKTNEFLFAIKPYLDVYFPQEVEKAFADVSPLIKRTTSVTFDKVLDNIDFDGRSHYNKSIRVAMNYTFPPAPKLKSW